MALVANTGLTLKDAISFSHDVYDLVVFNWGTDFQGGLPLDAYPAFTEPGLADSIAGIAIGPKSDVDRCWLTINPGKDVSVANQPWGLTRAISVGAPLLFEQPAKRGGALSIHPDYAIIDPPATLAQSLGLCYVVPEAAITFYRTESTMLPLVYQKADFTEVDVINDAIAKLTTPTLHLQFLLKRSVNTGFKRAPSREGNYVSVISGINETEQIIRITPIYGRRRVNVQVRGEHLTEPTATLTIRCAALRSLGADVVVQEETIGQKTADALGGCSFAFNFCDLGADFLIIYASSNVAAPAPGARVTGRMITAID